MLAEHLISCRSRDSSVCAKPLKKLSEVASFIHSFIHVGRITRKQQKSNWKFCFIRLETVQVGARTTHRRVAIILKAFKAAFCDFIICIWKSFLLLFLQLLCSGETNNFLALWTTKLLCWIVSMYLCSERFRLSFTHKFPYSARVKK